MATNNSINSAQGNRNTVVGDGALFGGTGSSDNTIIGADAITVDAAAGNTYIGSTIGSATAGFASSSNTAIGNGIFTSITDGAQNVAVGVSALLSVTAGSTNTAVGASALSLIDTGANNTVLGFNAGGSLTGADSDNICIGDAGILGDSNTLRIGTTVGGTTITSSFIGGIDGVDLGNNTVRLVAVSDQTTAPADQLGTMILQGGLGITISIVGNVVTFSVP